MHPFSLLNYVLVILAIMSHYCIGRRFKIDGILTASIVGVGLSALVVGSLANFCTAPIKYYLFITVPIGTVLSAYDIYFYLKQKKSLWLFYLLVMGLGVILLMYNQPDKLHFFKDSQGDPILASNYHYTARAVNVTEMLRGEYWGRIKQPQFFPHTFCTYHFFLPAVQAISSTFLPYPGLFTYFLVQACFMVMALLSFFEHLVLKRGISFSSIAFGLIWLSFGFAAFAPGVNLHFSGTGAFSIFAICHLVLSLGFRKPREALIFCVLLGASGLRNIPIAGIIGLTILFLFCWPKQLSKSLQKIEKMEWIGGLLFLVYSLSSVGFGSFGESLFGDNNKFQEVSLRRLEAYRILGWIYRSFSAQKEEVQRFYHLWFGGFISKMPIGSYRGFLFVSILLGLGMIALYQIIKNPKREKGPLIAVGFVGLSTLFSIGGGRDIFFLTLIWALYAGGVILFLSSLRSEYQRSDLNKILFCLIGYQTFYLYMYYSILTHEFKNSLAEIAWEFPLWASFGVFLMVKKWTFQYGTVFVGICAYVLSISTWTVSGLSQIPENFPYEARLIGVGPLFAHDFKRRDFVDENNFLKFENGKIGGKWKVTELLGTRHDSCAYARVVDTYLTALGAYYSFSKREECARALPNTRTVVEITR